MKKNYNQGQILVQVLVFGSIAFYLIGGFISWAIANIKVARYTFNSEQSIQIAEAGIDYYRWRLAHSPTDFLDEPGPIVKDFHDKDGNIIGQFSLDITPPLLGSTLVEIRSTGSVVADPNISRTIKVILAKPSFAKYSVVANNIMRFGEGTEAFGPIHSNQGIRFDGFAHNVVYSSVEEYNDPDDGVLSFGVQTRVSPADPSPPSEVPSRPDVFGAGRQFPVPAIDFSGITANLAQMRSDAQSNGFYRAGSGVLGYSVVLKTDNTFDLYRVTSFVNAPLGCTNVADQPGWSTWSIQNQELIDTYPMPTNGIIFLEDDVFIHGQIDGSRITVVAAYLPDNPLSRKNIIINNNLLYTSYDGSDVIGLIAQENINIGMVSENDLRIDAALIAQNGRVGRYYYRPPALFWQRCSPYHIRQTITSYGMIGTNQRYGFAYTDETGYQIRNLIYDANLLYGPPSSFPLTSDEYVTISWQEE